MTIGLLTRRYSTVGSSSSGGGTGNVNLKGDWNAATNSPALASGVGTKGDAYRVTVAGTTDLDGQNSWDVNDTAIFDGTGWYKQEGAVYAADIVDSTVFGRSVIRIANAAALVAALGLSSAVSFSNDPTTAKYGLKVAHSTDATQYLTIGQNDETVGHQIAARGSKGLFFTSDDTNAAHVAFEWDVNGATVPAGGTRAFKIFADGSATFGGALTVTGRLNMSTDTLLNLYNGASGSTGFYAHGANDLRVQQNGTIYHKFASGNLQALTGGGFQIVDFDAGSTKVALTDDGTDQLGLRIGTRAQIFRVYNTYTDASNYESLYLGWSSSNAYVCTTNSGTGGARTLNLGTTGAANLTLYTNNSTRLTLDSTGKLGIGSTSPYGLLSIASGNSSAGTGGSNISFEMYSGGYSHWITTRHDATAGTGNALEFYLNTSATSGGSSAPNTGNLLTLGLYGNGSVTAGGVLSATNGSFATGTITTSQPFSFTQTWNSSGVTFTGFKVNITSSASATGSLLADIQLGGTSKFSITKQGAVKAVLTNTSGMNEVDGAWGVLGWYAEANRGLSVVGLHGGNQVGAAGYFSSGRSSFGLPSFATTNTLVADSNGTTKPALSLWSTTANLVDFYVDGSAIAAQRTGTTAQAFRVYNTYTDSSNYERLAIDWKTTANVLRISTEAGGTGTVRNIALMGGNVGVGVTAPGALVSIAAGTTAKAQMNFASSTAPTTPNDGDMWFDGTNLKLRVSGTTYTLTKA